MGQGPSLCNACTGAPPVCRLDSSRLTGAFERDRLYRKRYMAPEGAAVPAHCVSSALVAYTGTLRFCRLHFPQTHAPFSSPLKGCWCLQFVTNSVLTWKVGRHGKASNFATANLNYSRLIGTVETNTSDRVSRKHPNNMDDK